MQGCLNKDGYAKSNLEIGKRNGRIHVDIKEGEHVNSQIKDLEKSIYQIQEKISIEQDGTLMKQVRHFMDKVDNMR